MLLACTAFTACAGFGGRAAPARTIPMDLSVSRADAVRRTLAAFREEGYRVKTTLTSGLAPETEPFREGDDAEAVFRAKISGSERASKVVLSGTYRRLRLAGTVRGREQEVREGGDDLERALWARLDQLRALIQRGGR
jgi:hypothetical protein